MDYFKYLTEKYEPWTTGKGAEGPQAALSCITSVLHLTPSPYPTVELFLFGHLHFAIVHVLDLSLETQRTSARECKPTDFEVPKTFLNRLQDLSACFLKDIAGKKMY